MTAVAELEENLQTLFGRHRRVAMSILAIGFLEAMEYPNAFFHLLIISPKDSGRASLSGTIRLLLIGHSAGVWPASGRFAIPH